MTTFVRTPRVASTPRPVGVHDPDCTRPGWAVQAAVIPAGPLLAHCRGCTAVRTVTTSERNKE